jgi:hypothetical protein
MQALVLSPCTKIHDVTDLLVDFASGHALRKSGWATDGVRLPSSTGQGNMASRVQQLAQQMGMGHDEFIGEMRKRGCSEPTAAKIWRGDYEHFDDFNDNDMYLSNLRKAAYVLKVSIGTLLPE